MIEIKNGTVYFYGCKVGYIHDTTAFINGLFFCGELNDWLRSHGYDVVIQQ